MTEIDLLTPMERKRKERNENMIRDFKEMAPQLTKQGCKPHRIMHALAEKYGMTIPGVRFVLMREGLYTSSVDWEKTMKNN